MVCLRRGWLACLMVVGLVWGKALPAQPPKDEAPPKPAAEPAAPPVDPEILRIHLMDGSTITGKLGVSELSVETSFGSLEIPVTSLRSFTPGMASHPELARNVAALIEDLGSNVFTKRESAQKALLKLGPAVRGELEQRADDPDNERRTRLREILEQFDEEQEAAEEEGDATPTLIRRDSIETAEFTVVGRIVPQAFTIASQYGPLQVKLSDIRKVESPQLQPAEQRKNLKIDGSHLANVAMLNSGLRLQPGDRVQIVAEGNITLTPWGNQAQSTPEGMPNFGWFVPNQIPVGAVVAKIGGNGPIFKIGNKHSFTADRAGVLTLGMAMMQEYANNQFPGEYRIRVRVTRKGM